MMDTAISYEGDAARAEIPGAHDGAALVQEPSAVGAYFDERADRWDKTAEPAGAKHEMFARLAGVGEGSRVLDIGCGTGIMERAYLALGAADVCAIDVSEKMIALAREKFADEPRVRFECADASTYREEDSALFDVVVMYNMYPHVLDKEALVRAVHRLLVPGGRFLVAHGTGYEAINAHHAEVPASVTSDLEPVSVCRRIWDDAFRIDETADTPFLYFFGGVKR